MWFKASVLLVLMIVVLLLYALSAVTSGSGMQSSANTKRSGGTRSQRLARFFWRRSCTQGELRLSRLSSRLGRRRDRPRRHLGQRSIRLRRNDQAGFYYYRA